MALGWQHRPERRRLRILDREGRELAVYYNPRIVGDPLERVSAWVKSELEAGRAVKPGEADARDRCTTAVGFKVSRRMLYESLRQQCAARGRGRPGGSRQ